CQKLYEAAAFSTPSAPARAQPGAPGLDAAAAWVSHWSNLRRSRRARGGAGHGGLRRGACIELKPRQGVHHPPELRPPEVGAARQPVDVPSGPELVVKVAQHV